jgi:hypothetical protein
VVAHELSELTAAMAPRLFHSARIRERQCEVRQVEGGMGTVFPSSSRRERRRAALCVRGRATRWPEPVIGQP